MPITKNIYICATCASRYDDFHEAIHCESMSKPEFRHRPGDVISFENEESWVGGRFSYYSLEGKVLLCHYALFTNKETGQKEHRPCYVVAIERLGMTAESVVYELGSEQNHHLVSLAGNTFNVGFHSRLKQSMLEDGITDFL